MRILFIFRNIFYPLMKRRTFLTVNFTFFYFFVSNVRPRDGEWFFVSFFLSPSVVLFKLSALIDRLSTGNTLPWLTDYLRGTHRPDWRLFPGNTLPWLTVIPGEHIAWFQDWARKTVLLCPPVLFTTPCQTAMMKTRIQGKISAFGVPCVYRQPEKCKSGKY